jgi:hypothetical protein
VQRGLITEERRSRPITEELATRELRRGLITEERKSRPITEELTAEKCDRRIKVTTNNRRSDSREMRRGLITEKRKSRPITEDLTIRELRQKNEDDDRSEKRTPKPKSTQKKVPLIMYILHAHILTSSYIFTLFKISSHSNAYIECKIKSSR